MDGLRIAMVTETYPPEVNGVARTVSEMVEGLRLRGPLDSAGAPAAERRGSRFLDGNLQEVLGRGIAIPRYPQLKLGLPARRALRRQWSLAPARCRAHPRPEGPLGWSALAAARDLDLPAATDFHTNFHTYSRHYGVGWLARPWWLICAASTTAPPARWFRRRAGRGPRPRRVSASSRRGTRRQPGGVLAAASLGGAAARWGAAEDTPVVLCVSRFAPEKNFPLVIKAFEAMRQARPDAKLVLVGDGR